MLSPELLKDIQADLKLVEAELDKYVQTPRPLLTQASSHLLKAGGKRLRPAFALIAGTFAEYSLEKLMPLAMALELIHMATLVHDDVVDEALTRRGLPTVKSIYGNAISIQTGDYLLAKSLSLIASYPDQRIASIFSKVSTEMCEGEILQIASAFDTAQNFRCYFYRIQRKTAMLISASCQLGAIVCNAPVPVERSLKRYGYYLGMAFQITDDILDLTADENVLGKPTGSDLKQGILTLPTIFALQENPRLTELLDSKFENPDSISAALDMIISCGAIKRSLKVANAFLKKAKKQLQYLPDTPSKSALLFLADFVGKRKY